MKNIISKEQWEAHIQSYKESGLTQTEYCRKKGLNKHTFSKWKRRLASADGFVEIAIGKKLKETSVTLIIDERLKVEVKKGFDIVLLKEIIEAARDL